MADRKYLKRRGERWYFQLRVPAKLRERVGKQEIVEALGTNDIRVARRVRWDRLAAWQERFDRLAGNKALTAAEIEAEAQNAMVDVVRALEPDNGKPSTVDPDEVIEGLDVWLGVILDDLRFSDYESVHDEADSIIEKSGAAMEKESSEYQALCHALLRARMEAVKAVIAAKSGEGYAAPPALNPEVIDPLTQTSKTPASKLRPTAAAGHRSVSTVVAAFVKDHQRDPKTAWSRQTLVQNEATYRMFSEFVRDAAIDSVGRGDVADFLDGLGTLNNKYQSNPKLRGASIWKLLDEGVGEPTLSNATLNRHKSALSVLFRWCVRRGWHEGPNPAADQSRPKAKRSDTRYLPFTTDELNTLFSGPWFQLSRAERVRPNAHTYTTAMSWVALIALFSGMRQGEICQLRPEDVRLEDGVHFFNVAEEGEGQSVKSEAGLRRVPVHSTLIDAGLLEYADFVRQQGQKQLFPRLRPGGADGKLNHYPQRLFNEYRSKLKVNRPRVVFHSFRATVITRLHNVGAVATEISDVVGHENPSASLRMYSDGLSLKNKSRVIEQIAYPGLELDRLIA
jgi:integrase